MKDITNVVDMGKPLEERTIQLSVTYQELVAIQLLCKWYYAPFKHDALLEIYSGKLSEDADKIIKVHRNLEFVSEPRRIKNLMPFFRRKV
jgi:hypothetical protein